MFLLLIIIYLITGSSFARNREPAHDFWRSRKLAQDSIIKNNNKLNILNINKNIKSPEYLPLNEFSQIKNIKKDDDSNSTETFQTIMPPNKPKPVSPLIQSSLLFLYSEENNLENNLEKKLIYF